MSTCSVECKLMYLVSQLVQFIKTLDVSFLRHKWRFIYLNQAVQVDGHGEGDGGVGGEVVVVVVEALDGGSHEGFSGGSEHRPPPPFKEWFDNLLAAVPM